MRFLLPLSLFLSLSSAQFVFFGGNQPQRPSFLPSFQGPRFGVRPSAAAVVPTFQDHRQGRFSSTFFRPTSPLNTPSKEPTKSVDPVAAPVAVKAAAAAATTTARPSVAPKGNYQWEGKSYLLTWRTGRNNFAWNEGVSYCRSQGMKLISLDSKEKADHFLSLVGSDRAPYFWAGGEVSSDSRRLTWQNGQSEPVTRGQHPWSFTGRTGPQPDGGERCLAILNNVYRDGVKFHDVACHHRKPVVCEE